MEQETTTSFFDNKKTIYQKIAFFVVIFFLFTPYGSPSIGLILGILIAFTLGSPFPDKKISSINKLLLQYAIVGLGFGMNIETVLKTGVEGIGITLISIGLTLALGLLLGKLLATDKKISFLVSAGTAICGGSAIGALTPIVDSDSKQTSVAMGVVFILNAMALFIFPQIGHFFTLSNEQFAWWAAIAIHDTSSVVGAAAQYGDESLVLATTIKLTRALWIVPFALATAFFLKQKDKSAPFPYFMLYFLAAAMLNSYLPFVQNFSPYFVKLAKIIFSIVLFLVGLNLSKSAIQSIGFRPIIQGVVLWIIVSVVALLAVMKLF